MLDPRDQIMAFFTQLVIHRSRSRQFLQDRQLNGCANGAGIIAATVVRDQRVLEFRLQNAS
jgi:hypothetical protein